MPAVESPAKPCGLCGATMITANALDKPFTPFCANCDRLRCGKCKQPVMDPRATACPCGNDVRMTKEKL